MPRASLLSWLAAFILLGAAASDAQSLKHCFNDTEFDGWWKPEGDKTIYIRTGRHRYYRLDLREPCGTAAFPGAHLVLEVHGSDIICSPLDFDLRVSQGMGDIAQPCFVKTMSEASPREVVSLENHAR